LRAPIAILLAVIVVTATGVLVAEKLSSSSAAAPVVGPAVEITINSASLIAAHVNPSSALAGNVTVQIFSVVPTAKAYTAVNLTALNSTTNSYDDELFQGSADSSSIISGHLSAQFSTIDQAWLATMSPITTTVSLQLHATLNVVSNGIDHVYTYFNNLPYNPRAPPANFSASVSFPTQPSFSVPVPASSPSSAVTPDGMPPGGGCNQWYWDLWNETIILGGYMPLAIASISGAPTGAQLWHAISYSKSAMQLSFTSASAVTTSSSFSGLQMSQSPSWSGDDTTFQGANPGGTATEGGNAVTMVALSGFDLAVINYQWVFVNSACVITQYSHEYQNDLQVTVLQNGANFVFVTPTLPSYFSGLMNDMNDWQLLTTETLPWGGGGYALYTVMSTATGYNNAQGAEKTEEDALSALSACIGAALLVDDVSDLIVGFGEVTSTATAIELLGEVAGDAALFMSLFNTISFSTSETTSVQMFTVNVGNGGTQTSLVSDIYETTQTAELVLPSGTYTPNMPLVYVTAT
jgi:hypothetical protein